MSVYKGSSLVVVFGTLAVLLLVNIDLTSAKRGCTAFGHSCFGGHGKRSDADMAPNLYPGEIPQTLEQTAEDDMRAVPLLPIDLGTQYRPYNMSPLIRQWLQTYRQSGGSADN